jgi:hypothetical protein
MNWKIKLNFILSFEVWRLALTKTSGQSKSILVGCRFKNENSFSDSKDESKLQFVKNFVGHFLKKALVQMNFRSNDHFLEKAFSQMKFRSFD